MYGRRKASEPHAFIESSYEVRSTSSERFCGSALGSHKCNAAMTSSAGIKSQRKK